MNMPAMPAHSSRHGRIELSGAVSAGTVGIETGLAADRV
jgi:hypothetical protein